jgi:COP9 signalosome complex subunit 2
LDQARFTFEEIFTFISETQNRIYAEKSLMNMLDLLISNVDRFGFSEVEKFFITALSSLRTSNSDRLWLKVKLKLAKLMLDTEHYVDLSRSVKEIYQLSSVTAGNTDPSTSSFLLDVYALEMQMASRIGNTKLLKVRTGMLVYSLS